MKKSELKRIIKEVLENTVGVVYVEQNDKFYSFKNKSGRLNYEDANKYIKNLTGLTLPKKLDDKLLDQIKSKLESKGINFDYSTIDVS